jgi:hypothetical protein
MAGFEISHAKILGPATRVSVVYFIGYSWQIGFVALYRLLTLCIVE